MLGIIGTLAKNEKFTSPRLGLWSNAIMQIICKHMDEKQKKESEQVELTGQGYCLL